MGAERLEPGIRRLRAPNPSPMTERGTNTYIVGEGRVAVIDPGPALQDHLAAILDALEPGETVSHILVTHSHRDHAPLARPLAQATGAPVLGWGDPAEARSAVMQTLAAEGATGGGEGLDRGFRPDERLADGATVEGEGWRLEVLHTPGHIGDHLSFAFGDAVFTGDHVMAWASSMVSPPDGDLSAFMASCRRLQSRTDRVFYPGHGDPVDDPAGRLDWLIGHRLQREAQILDALSAGPAGLADLTARIYIDTDPALHPAAARNVLAHLIDLWQRGHVATTGNFSISSRFRRRSGP